MIIRGARKSPIQPKETIFDIARGFKQVSEIDSALRELHGKYETLLQETSNLSKAEVQNLLREVRSEADRKLAQLLREAADGNANTFKRLLGELQYHVHQAVNAIEHAKTIQKGDAGVDGKDAITPVRGQDYFTESDVQAMVQMVLNRIRQPQDGKDAVVRDEMLAEALENFLKKGKLSHKHIKDLEDIISPIRHAAVMRGGGDTVAAGSNITITTNSSGAKVIASTGGSSAWSTPAEAVNGSTTVFTVDAEPTDVIADGIHFFPGFGYTYAALQITFTNPPFDYVRYR